MDFFGYGNSGAMESRVDDLIQKATDHALIGPDWAANMEICDYINSESNGAEDAARALLKRLQTGSSKIVQLTLTVIEAAVKNCNTALHVQVAKREFLNEIAALTDGSKGREVGEQAVSLIQQWGMAFAGQRDNLSSFHDTYMRLKMQGIHFPPTDSEVPIFTPPASASYDNRKESSQKVMTLEEEFKKLHDDLDVVEEKITAFKDFHSRGIEGEDVEDLLDFLNQCRPRLNTLIEAGISGKLDEDTLSKCLKVNDDLVKVLEGTDDPKEKSITSSSTDLLNMDQSPRKDILSGMANLKVGYDAAHDDDFDNFALKNSRRGANQKYAPSPAPAPAPVPAISTSSSQWNTQTNTQQFAPTQNADPSSYFPTAGPTLNSLQTSSLQVPSCNPFDMAAAPPPAPAASPLNVAQQNLEHNGASSPSFSDVADDDFDQFLSTRTAKKQ